MATQPEFAVIAPRRMHEMQARLEELEEILRAIHHGEVDAVVVSGPQGDRVFTLQGAEHPYRVMVETINEGTASLTSNGLVLYANRRFSEMVSIPLEQLIGSRLHDVVETSQHTALDELLKCAQEAPQKEEFYLLVTEGKPFPAYLSLSPLEGADFQGICMIATDLTEQKSRQEELAKINDILKAEIAERERVESALRQLSGRLLSLQDEERRRIARDLHDSTAQTLSALALNLASIQSQKDMQGDPRTLELLARSLALAERASEEIRNLSHLLHPPLLDQVGLIAAIEWHSMRVREASGIEINLDLPVDLKRLPEDIEIALFRILQESLENVRRHSGSPAARVSLIRHEEEIVLEVKDQGHGASPGVLTNAGQNVARVGVGVAGMRERLRQLGGRLEIESGHLGTTVRAIIPVREAGHPSASKAR